jgi:hypothetical protein
MRDANLPAHRIGRERAFELGNLPRRAPSLNALTIVHGDPG